MKKSDTILLIVLIIILLFAHATTRVHNVKPVSGTPTGSTSASYGIR